MTAGEPATLIAAPPGIMEPLPAQVLSVDKETHDTFTLRMEQPPGMTGFRPGQFSMLYVFGVGELPISISGDPEHPGELTYTVRSVGPVTYQLVTRQEGESAGIQIGRAHV